MNELKKSILLIFKNGWSSIILLPFTWKIGSMESQF